MKKILEYWEFSKNIYGHNKYVNQSFDDLVKFSEEYLPEEGRWYSTISGTDVFIKEIKNDVFIGHDREGRNVKGHINDILDILTNEKKTSS